MTTEKLAPQDEIWGLIYAELSFRRLEILLRQEVDIAFRPSYMEEIDVLIRQLHLKALRGQIKIFPDRAGESQPEAEVEQLKYQRLLLIQTGEFTSDDEEEQSDDENEADREMVQEWQEWLRMYENQLLQAEVEGLFAMLEIDQDLTTPNSPIVPTARKPLLTIQPPEGGVSVLLIMEGGEPARIIVNGQEVRMIVRSQRSLRATLKIRDTGLFLAAIAVTTLAVIVFHSALPILLFLVLWLTGTYD